MLVASLHLSLIDTMLLLMLSTMIAQQLIISQFYKIMEQSQRNL